MSVSLRIIKGMFLNAVYRVLCDTPDNRFRREVVAPVFFETAADLWREP